MLILNKYPLILIMLVLLGITCLRASSAEQAFTHAYLDPRLPPEQRVAALLSRMTIEEKIAQMDMLSGRQFANNAYNDAALVKSTIGTLGVGSVHDFYPSSPELANELQKLIIESSRFGIPALFIEEMLHGYVQEGSTVFPIPLAFSSSWNPELVKSIGHAIASEARAKGTHAGLCPVLDLAREPSWGRVEETYGEDTYLVSVTGQAMVEGMQGENLQYTDAVCAVLKHFAMHGVPESGTNSSPASVGKREALQFFLPPFEDAIVRGGARGVLSAYSEWNGVPCTGDEWLLHDLLRMQWGFTGFTVADMGGIRMLSTCHFVTESPSSSLKLAVSSGMDMQFYDFPSDVFRREMLELMQTGELDTTALNRAAGDILRVKFELGLFENPYIDVTLSAKVTHSPEHQSLSLQAARESIVLLENNSVLPLSNNIKKIAVVGPAAVSNYAGGYSPVNSKCKTLLEGLQEIAGKTAEIRYAQGVSFCNEGAPIPLNALLAPDMKTRGLAGNYFPNADLAGTPQLTRIDPQVDFNWDTHSPAEGIPPDSFSVRWEGWLIPNEDFDGWIGVSSDDGSRLWLDDALIIDTWNTSANIRRYDVSLKGCKKYKIRMEYREIQWGASASLRWSKGAENIPAAVKLAQWADVAIAAVGENEMLIGENRDRMSLELSGNQADLVNQVALTGKPVVVVLKTGRPVALGNISPQVDAVIEAWFGGEFAGQAVAEVLFGIVNPSGKLPITFPKYSGQIPCFYNRKPSKIMRYADGDAQPQYPFGHGLSYSSFEYSGLVLETDAIGAEDKIRFSVKISNTSKVDGTAIAQIYIRDLYSSVTTPLKELKAFQRVVLKAGESKVVQFSIPTERLALVNYDFKRVVEPGAFELMVGESSEDIRLKTKFEID